jgi:prevent-host-death family protein
LIPCRGHDPDVVPTTCYCDHVDVGVRDLKAKLSEYLARVEQGETVNVTSRGRRVAQIVPAVGETAIERGLREGWLTQKVDRPPAKVVPVEPAPGTPTSEELFRQDREDRF